MTPDEQERIVRECSRLVQAFAIHVDRGEAEQCAALFCEAATFERKGEVLAGRPAILAAQKARAPGLRTRHHCLAPWITVIDADHAEGITYFTNYRHEGKEPLHGPAPLAGAETVGEFYDNFVRTPDGWRIAARRAQAAFRRVPTVAP
jgi:SnoaL-like domain